MDNIEAEKHKLETERVRGELKSRELELELKREEIALRRDELRNSLWKNPLILAIVAALIGFLGNSYIAGKQGEQTLELEKQKLQNSIKTVQEKRESDLLLESIKTGEPEIAAKNLNFLVSVGLIDDSENKIKSYLSGQNKTPFLPAKNASDTLNVNCSSSRDCTQTRDCSFPVKKDTRNCSACLVKDPISGKCLTRGNDPVCEVAKATQNNAYQAEIAAKKIDCERIKAQQKLVCEAEKAREEQICEAGVETIRRSQSKNDKDLTSTSKGRS